MSYLSPGIQMRDRLLFDIWEPHTAILGFPVDSAAAGFLRIYDEAYELLVAAGQAPDEAASTVRVTFGSGLPSDGEEI
jgi:hypothetical protein